MKALLSAFSGDNRTRDVLLVLVVSVLLWEAAVVVFQPPIIFLPPPSAVWAEFMSSPGIFLKHMGYTLSTTAVAFALSVIFGVILAVCIVQSPFLERTVYTLLVALNSVPKVALAPLFIVWLGIGAESRLSFAVFISFFPVVIATLAGLDNVDRNLLRLCRALRASEWQVFRDVRLPFALPYVFSGMKIATTFSIIGVIVGEFITSQAGLGYLVLFAAAQAETELIFAAVAVLCAFGLVFYGAIALIEIQLRRRFGA